MKLRQILASVFAASALFGFSQSKLTIQVPADPSNRVEFAADQLKKAFSEKGYTVTVATTPKKKSKKKAPKPDGELIRLSQTNDTSLQKEGFTLLNRGGVVDVIGNDGTGVIYGAREIINRLNGGAALSALPDSLSDAPEMVLRGTAIGIQKPYLLPGRQVYEYPLTPELFPWFYDKEQWIKYLDMLVDNRMNSVYLWNGHPFASIVKLKDYPFAVEVDDETFKKNEEMYGFLTEEADKRGIYVIQMFYNILLSKPFAEHYGMKTQDRNRPIDPLVSDYTRKSVAAFIEKYPNVGLLVCLGEAMATYEDDVVWFTETIIPGVKDGLKALGRTDEPPILLRAHDTDGKAVMEAALPSYKTLNTMHKYNGESLTTYQPRGPWTEIHRNLSNLGSVHISNVHILANLEPWRWSSPDFTQKAVQAMHDVHGANALHLYPQASYWDWPYSADSIAGGKRLQQLDRDAAWYEAWARYAWDCRRDRNDEMTYWNGRFAQPYGLSDEDGKYIRIAFEESGEIAPKLLRRFGITEGNRQTLLLGMFVSQLVNPYKYTIYPGFYESCGPEGEKLIEWVEKEHKGLPHVGELPLDITAQTLDHADKAVAAIERVEGKATTNADELARVANDMRCYREFAYAFDRKVKAARHVLDYQYTHDIADLDAAVPLLEESLEHWRRLVDLTKGTYLYANSMQTTMRRIPIAGDDGKNKTWAEMLVHYENELANFKKNIAMLKDSENGVLVPKAPIVASHPANVTLEGDWKRVKIEEGATLLSNRPDATVKAVAPELVGLEGIVVDGDRQRQEGTPLTFTCSEPVSLLVGFFKDDQKKYAKAPKLEIDATANEYGQAEPLLTNGILLDDKMPLANIHSYSFQPGKHTINLPFGYLLVLGFTDSKIAERNAALAGADETMDWLFY